jgi:hypothetical protein
MTNRTRTPDFMPTLSPGRHRSPRKGACFMEMASYLAGEKWSDHPQCTHPLVAAMAREINDRVGDRMRQDLVPLIPSVVGLVSDDVRVDAWIAREAALTALPIVSMSSQRAVAVGVLRSEAVLNALDGRPADELTPRAKEALAQAPEAERWAREFIGVTSGRRDAFVKRGAPAVVHHAVAGISRACVSDPEKRLVDLLNHTIDGVRQLSATSGSQVASREIASPTSDVEPAKDSLR